MRIHVYNVDAHSKDAHVYFKSKSESLVLDLFSCVLLVNEMKQNAKQFIYFCFSNTTGNLKNASTDNLGVLKSFKIIWLELKANGGVDYTKI